MDLQQLLAAAQQMQDHLMSAQQELADAEVEGTSGGGLVKARVNGQGELVELTISPAAIDPADPADTAQTVADLVLAAVRPPRRSSARPAPAGPAAAHSPAVLSLRLSPCARHTASRAGPRQSVITTQCRDAPLPASDHDGSAASPEPHS